MKHRLAIFLISIICCGMLFGCQQSEETDIPVSAGSETVSESSPPEVVLEPLPDMEDTILANRVLWENSTNLYQVPLDILTGAEQTQVCRFGNDLLLTYYIYDQEIRKTTCFVSLVSIETGEVLYEQQLGDLTYGEVQILDRHVAVNDQGDSKCYLLDSELELVGTYDIQGGRFCLNNKGDTAYLFTYDQGLQAIDLATGETTVILDQVANLYMNKANREVASFVYTDMNTLLRESGILDLSSGQIQTVESEYAYNWLQVGNETMLGKVDTEEAMYVISKGEEQGRFFANLSAETNLNSMSGHIMISEMVEDGETIHCVYDSQGKLLSHCNTAGLDTYLYTDPIWYEEYQGYVFAQTDENGYDHLFFWDISENDYEDTLFIEDVAEVTKPPVGSAVSQALFDRARALSEKYGIDILIADQCDEQFTDHTATLLLDEAEITQALNTLEYALEQYPKGFIDQLKHNTYRRIEIQILGLLEKDTSEDEISFISGGFVNYSYPGKLVMALDARAAFLEDDINLLLAQTIYHEVSHMIDIRLEYDALYRMDAVYSDIGWEELNPEGFEYNWSYYGTLDPAYAAYFVDDYACSNGTEDRARTMEYAMAGETWIFEEKSGLTEKLAYYCEGIRDSFDTSGWPEELPWEATLHAVQ